jgi:hypothetical protein
VTRSPDRNILATIRRVLPAALGLCLLAAAGCSEEPTVGNSLVAELPLTGFVTKDTTITATTGRAYRTYVPQDGLLNLVGRNGTYSAYLLLQFSAAWLPDRDTAAVFSASLKLRSATWAGTSGAPFGFTVHRITRAWSPYTVTWDSVGVDPIASGFCEATPRGTFAGGVGLDSAEFALDTTMVREWLQTTTPTTTSQFGVILIPSAQTQNGVQGFKEFSDLSTIADLPTLTVIAGNTAGTILDTNSYRVGFDTFVGTDTHPTGPADDLIMQGGVHYRSTLSFDVSGIPRGAIINRATLTLAQDVSASRISTFITDPAIASHIPQDSTDLRKLNVEDPNAIGRPVSAGASTWKFDVWNATQSWLRGPNYGLVLRVPSAQEYQSADVYAFYNALAADSSLRPRLSVLYSIKSK